MNLNRANADQLATFADAAAASEFVSGLVGQLVLACPETTISGFRTGNGLQIKSWDGTTASKTGNAFVPHGGAVWEISKHGTPESKANADYTARLHEADPAIAYVAVMLRRWGGKEKWAKTKMSGGAWRSVRVLDADDLYHWLLQHPAIHDYATRQIFQISNGPPLFAPPKQVPLPPQDFIGRATELQDVADWHSQLSAQRSRTLVISGLGGVGKSVLSAAITQLLSDEYPEGELFVDFRANAAGDATSVRSKILGYLQPDADSEDLAQTHNAFFSALSNKKFIVVLDNVEAEEQLEGILPVPGSALAIVTSRARLHEQDGAMNLELLSLDPPEALAFLQRFHHDIDASSTADVANLCGYLPLALRIAGGLASGNSGSGFKNLANQLRDGPHRLTQLEMGQRGIQTIFDLAYSRLSPSSRRLMPLLTLVPGSVFDSQLASWISGLEVHIARTCLRELSDLYLLERAPWQGQSRFHPLVAVYASNLLEAHITDESRERFTGSFVEKIIGWLLSVLDTGAEPSTAHNATTNGDTWLATVDERWVVVAATIIEFTPMLPSDVLAVLCIRLADYGVARNGLSRWPELLARCAEITKTNFHRTMSDNADYESNKQAYAAVLNVVASYEAERGSVEVASRSANTALNLATSLKDGVLVITALTCQGHIARRNSDSGLALQKYREALGLAEEIELAGLVETCRYNVGNVLREMGRYPEAMDHLISDLKVCRDRKDFWGEATTLNTLGIVLSDTGQILDAIVALRDSLAIFERLEDQKNASNARFDLGRTYLIHGSLVEAETLFQADLDYCLQTSDHCGAAHTTLMLIHATSLQHQRVSSQKLEEAAAALEVLVISGPKSHVPGARLTYASILEIGGRTKSSLALKTQALAEFRELGLHEKAAQVLSILKMSESDQ